MITALVSDKGQITLPANIRRKLGIKARSRVEIQVGNGQVVVRPIRSVLELSGILHEYAKGKPTDWTVVRDAAEKAVAEEVASEDRR